MVDVPARPTLLHRAARSVDVAAMLVRRELTADLRVSRMSLAWPLVYPIAYTILVVFMRPVFGSGRSTASAGHFAVFVFAGFCLYQSWFEMLRRQMDAVRANKALVARAEIGSATLFLATLFSTGFHLVPRVLLAMLLAALLLQPPAWAYLVFAAGSGLVLLNGAVIGALLQPFSTLSPDLGKAVQSISLGFLITGAVFVPLPDSPSRAITAVVSINPLGALLNIARAPLLNASPIVPVASVVWAVVTFALLALILVMGKRILPILIERIGN
jgi:lipopolysaccharide transport system permease protein